MNNINIVGDYRVKVRFWGRDWWSRSGHFEKSEPVNVGGSRVIDLPGPLMVSLDLYDEYVALTLFADGVPFPLWSYSGTIPTAPMKVRTSWKGGEVTAYVSLTTG